MNLNLQRLMSRSAGGDLQQGSPGAPSRTRRKSMIALAILGLIALVATGATASYLALVRPTPLRIAVGPANSEDLRVIQVLAQAFGRERSRIRLRIVQTDGATASAEALATGKADLAVVRGDLNLPKDAMAVATLRKNVVALFVPPAPKGRKAAAKITTIPQLAGKRIGVIGRTAANVELLKTILMQYAVNPAKVEIVQFSTGEIAQAVQSSKVDVFLAAGPVNSRITNDAVAATMRNGKPPTFIAIDSADAIAANHPAYEATEIPAGAFGGSPARPDDDVKTIGFSHHIVARKSLAEATVANFTRQLFAVRQSVMAELPQASRIETPDTDKDAGLPAHPGAAAYVDGEERTFLDRYSDYIWGAIMLMSALGSAGAWFASRWRDERTGSPLRERLMAMLSLARVAPSNEDLSALQAEADDILRLALDGFEQGSLSESGLTAFDIAITQFHNAVADRRTFLADSLQSPARPRPVVA